MRITNKGGKVSTKKSPGKRERVVQHPCFLCHLWEETKNTQWMCADCSMALCPKSVTRADPEQGRIYESLVEHHMLGFPGVRCGKEQKEHRITPAMKEYTKKRE